jgi:hypothetical protein
MQFMSIESATRCYLFTRLVSSDDSDHSQASDDSQPYDDSQPSDHFQPPDEDKDSDITEVPWTHNYLHDLESLWWVAVWIVFYNVFRDPKQPKESDAVDTTYQLQLTQSLFPPTLSSSHRQNGFQWEFPKLCDQLPSTSKIICRSLNNLRGFLIQEYTKAEKPLPRSLKLSTSDKVYKHFRQYFRLIQDKFENFTLSFIPDIEEKLEGKRKRLMSVEHPLSPPKKLQRL